MPRHPNLAVPFTAVVLTALALACGGAAPVPSRLAGLDRTSLVDGAEAAAAVARLHGKDVAPADSAIAEYGHGALTLFVSRYGAARDASEALAAMLARIEAGGTPFTRPLPMPGRPGVHVLRGPGGHHAVFRAGRAVYWLQGDPALLDRGVAEVR